MTGKKTRGELVKYEDNVRDINDRRKKVSKAVFSYYDHEGVEYRKSFTSVPYTPELEFWNIAPIYIG